MIRTRSPYRSNALCILDGNALLKQDERNSVLEGKEARLDIRGQGKKITTLSITRSNSEMGLRLH